jgi:hypothetical protein
VVRLRGDSSARTIFEIGRPFQRFSAFAEVALQRRERPVVPDDVADRISHPHGVIRRQIEDVRLDPAATDERSVVCQSLRHTAP